MNEVVDALSTHWALDQTASEYLANEVLTNQEAEQILSFAQFLNPDSVIMRNKHREYLSKAFVGQEAGAVILAFGPCSLDFDVDYLPLFDYLSSLQEEYPAATILFRGNGAKPRTSIGWTGLWYDTDPRHRQAIFDVYNMAFERGIPIITEITEGTQLGALAPYLSAAWIGARDIEATSRRSKFAAYHLPVGIKNGINGDLNVVDNTISAVRSNSNANDGSGVDLGTIASNSTFRGIPSGIVPVGEGNPSVAIFARGYELPLGLSKSEKRMAALEYISRCNLLSRSIGSAVLIDGTHSVPPMFDISKKYADRLVPVLEEIHKGIEEGLIEHSEQIIGVMGEVGVVEGRTDPNYVLDRPRKKFLREALKTTVELLSTNSYL